MTVYKNYKESGIEQLGKIPTHWQVKKLKRLAKICGGEDQKDVVDDDGIFPIYGSGGIFGKANKFLHSGPSVLLGRKGTIDKPQYVHTPFWSVDTAFYTDIFPDTNPRYFYYLCTTINFELYKYGSAVPSMSRETLNQISFVCPSLTEQTALADYLDNKTSQIDKLIIDKEKLIHLLSEERTALINQSVTKGLNPDLPVVDSGVDWLGEIPTHWEVKKLKYLVKEPLKYGANEPADGDNPENPRYIRITDFGNDGKLRNDTFKSLPNDIAKEYLLKDGDILFARSGATVGKTFQFKDYEGTACFAGYLIKAEANEDVILSDFLYLFTKSGNYENWKDSIFQQATIQNIGADKYNQLKIAIPAPDEQRQILNVVNAEIFKIQSTIETVHKEIEYLREYKIALISEVVTGKIDVRDEVISESLATA